MITRRVVTLVDIFTDESVSTPALVALTVVAADAVATCTVVGTLVGAGFTLVHIRAREPVATVSGVTSASVATDSVSQKAFSSQKGESGPTNELRESSRAHSSKSMQDLPCQ